MVIAQVWRAAGGRNLVSLERLLLVGSLAPRRLLLVRAPAQVSGRTAADRNLGLWEDCCWLELRCLGRLLLIRAEVSEETVADKS